MSFVVVGVCVSSGVGVGVGVCALAPEWTGSFRAQNRSFDNDATMKA